MPDTATTAPAGSHAQLDHKLLRGIAWTGGMKWATQIIAWSSTLVLARLLTPADYGLVGMANLYLGLVALFTEFGLGASVITLRDLTDDEIAQLKSAALLLGLGGTALTCAAAWPLGLFFRAPDLPPVVLGLSLTFVLNSVRSISNALLQRELRFRALAAVDGIQAIVFALANVVFALLGFRYWSLVLGGLVSNALAGAMVNLLRPHRYAWPTRAGLRRTIRFSRDVLVGRLAWYAYSNADFLVAGRMLGPAALGAYSFAWTIASVPVEKVTSLVTRVTPAFFSRLQHDDAGLRRLLANVTEGLAFLTLPASLGMVAVAGDFVRVALGPRWEAAIVPLQFLSILVTFRSIMTLLPQILMAKGDTRYLMWNGIATALVLPVGFVIGSRWGAGGIAAIWLVLYPVFVVPLYVRTFRAIGMSFHEYTARVWPALRGSLLMLVPVLALKFMLPAAWPPALRLGVEVGAGALTFFLTTLLPQRQRLIALFQLIRTPNRPAPSAAPA